MVVKGTVLQFVVRVSKRMSPAHFISVTEMVVPSAQTLGLHLEHSALHRIQKEPHHLYLVKIQKADEQIHEQTLGEDCK